MKKIFLTIIVSILVVSPVYPKDDHIKIAIIKADDIRKPTPEWERFFQLSKEKGVKVSAGIICSSMEGGRENYHRWLQNLNDSGWVEFWNHGWDHKRWFTEDSTRISEFSGTDYSHQVKHFQDSQDLMERVLGSAPVAFGAPYNALDSVGMRVLDDSQDIHLFFSYRSIDFDDITIAPMKFRGEHDGTGKPNFEAFRAAYLDRKDVTFSSIQFHPNNFDDEHFIEYARIIDFLMEEGWSFMLPHEYLSWKSKHE